MVPGSSLVDFLLPQDFLPQLFPVIQARVGNTRDKGLPIWSLQGDSVGWLSWQAICRPKGPASVGPLWTSVSQDAIGPALEQSDQKGAPDSCPDSQPAGDPRHVPEALCISISLVSTMTISGESPWFTSETPWSLGEPWRGTVLRCLQPRPSEQTTPKELSLGTTRAPYFLAHGGWGVQGAFLPARPSLIFLHRRSPTGPWPGKQTTVDLPPELFFRWPPRCPGFLASSSPLTNKPFVAVVFLSPLQTASPETSSKSGSQPVLA